MNKHEDTSVSLAPLSVDQAIQKLTQTKRKGSQSAESDSTKSGARPALETLLADLKRLQDGSSEPAPASGKQMLYH